MKFLEINRWIPAIFLLGMLLDGQLSSIMESITRGRCFTLSGLLLLMFLLGAKSFNKRYLLILVAVTGFLGDVYFTGIVGLNTFLYPLFTFGMIYWKDVINQNIFTQLAGFIVVFTMYQVFLAFLQVLFQLVTINSILFIVSILGPSILFNLLVFIVFIWPLRWIFKKKVKS
jgi:rod shape-determining protein MreD